MAALPASLVVAIVTALLVLAAAVRTGRALYRWMELSGASDDNVACVDDVCRMVFMVATLLLLPMRSWRHFIIPRLLSVLWRWLCETIQLGLWMIAILVFGAAEIVMLCWGMLDHGHVSSPEDEDVARSLRARACADRANRAALLASHGEFPVEAWVANALSSEATWARAVSRRLARATFALRSLIESRARYAKEIASREQEEEARRCARLRRRANLYGLWLRSM
jgi:hypothetical protein